MGHATTGADERTHVDHDARMGVLHCLQMLVEEAVMLGLTETAAALDSALALGHSESGLHRCLRRAAPH